MRRLLFSLSLAVSQAHAGTQVVTFDLMAKNCAAWGVNPSERDAYLAGMFTAYNETAKTLNGFMNKEGHYRSETGIKVGFLGLRERTAKICSGQPSKSIADAATDAWFQAMKSGD